MESNSATAAKQLFRAAKGNTFIRQFKFYDDIEKTQPSDLTGKVYDIAIRKGCEGAPLVELHQVVDGNTITVSASASQMQLPCGKYSLKVNDITDIADTSGDDCITLIDGTLILE